MPPFFIRFSGCIKAYRLETRDIYDIAVEGRAYVVVLSRGAAHHGIQADFLVNVSIFLPRNRKDYVTLNDVPKSQQGGPPRRHA
jgi:hypothetical protein